MESNFSNRDFEQFVKQNADQYRMFPSEKVWKGINGTLHTKRKWYGFWLSVLLLATGGAVTWVMTTYPPGKKSDHSEFRTPLASTPSASLNPAASKAAIENLLSFKQAVPLKEQLVSLTPSTDASITASLVPENQYSALEPLSSPLATIEQSNPLSGISNSSPTEEATLPLVVSGFDLSTPLVTADQTAAVSSYLANTPVPAKQNEFPLTIESVVNHYKHQKPPKRISWQVFVTPTVSYRRLSVNKSFDNPSPGVFPFAYLSDVNSVVTHKPDLGVQLGVSAGYPLTKSLKLRGGLQFNINRYDIKAYQFNGEVATIDLNGGPGNNTISTWTYYRNYSGYKSDWLKNYYFSVSVPIGAELKLFGNNKTSVGVASTIQPTYVLNDRAYLISTDFKNYAEVPRLIRHVNLNTSFETFINYTSGKTKWQVGPQVRYQILSSFQNTYPVKENLFDFGLKVGVTLNQ